MLVNLRMDTRRIEEEEATVVVEEVIAGEPEGVMAIAG